MAEHASGSHAITAVSPWPPSYHETTLLSAYQYPPHTTAPLVLPSLPSASEIALSRFQPKTTFPHTHAPPHFAPPNAEVQSFIDIMPNSCDLVSYSSGMQAVPMRKTRRTGGRRPKNDDNMPPEERVKLDQRRERNKLAAQRCRLKRLQQIESLQQNVNKANDQIRYLSGILSQWSSLIREHASKCSNYAELDCLLRSTEALEFPSSSTSDKASHNMPGDSPDTYQPHGSPTSSTVTQGVSSTVDDRHLQSEFQSHPPSQHQYATLRPPEFAPGLTAADLLLSGSTTAAQSH